jgi:membrane protein DedA with SNARE-associated domain
MSSPALPGIFGALAPTLNHYGYLAVAFFVTVEDFGIPVPGETILIAAALFAGAGHLNVVVVGIVGFLAAIVGDNIGFAIGHFGGRALALRWGKYVFLTPERLNKAEAFFERHGGKIIVVARFIEGLRQANGIVAGITGMHWRKFVLFNAIGAALWVGVWVSVGYLAGNHITAIYNQITRYSLYALIAAAVAVVAFIAWHLRRRAKRRAARSAAATATAEDPGAGAADGPADGTAPAPADGTAPAPPAAQDTPNETSDVPNETHQTPGGTQAPPNGSQEARPAEARPRDRPGSPAAARDRDQPPDTPESS